MLRKLLLPFCFCLLFSSCAFFASLPTGRELSFSERLAVFPTKEIPVIAHPIEVRWNEKAVPYIYAETDEDGFFALGAVHAHLRLGQMELLKRIAQGRISEMAGPLTRDIDHTLRIIGFGNASAKIVENLSVKEREWLRSFVAGINWYRLNVEELPKEFGLLGLDVDELWTEEDVVTVSRLAGADLSWMFYFSFLRIKDVQVRADAWQEFLRTGRVSPISFMSNEMPQELALITEILGGLSKSGSNSYVIDSEKSESGAPLIANDPHLGVGLPNFWLLGSLNTPSFQVTGMMIPGLPFFALGRNKFLSWGGTNMRGISSHLYQTDQTELKCREVKIKSRGWFATKREICASSKGPLLSDSPLLSHLTENLALNWVGHRTDTSELSTFWRMNQATSAKQFRAAFRGYGVSAQNFLFATKNGDIGQVLAYRQPVLKDPRETLSLIKSSKNPVVDFRDSTELPFVLNPSSGFVASANNKPAETFIPIAFSYSHSDRVNRLQEYLGGQEVIRLADLKKLQLDTVSESAIELKKSIVDYIDKSYLQTQYSDLTRALQKWDGHFEVSSRGALAYHLIISELVPIIIKNRVEIPQLRKLKMRSPYWEESLRDFLSSSLELNLKTLEQVLKKADDSFRRFNSWGDIHRLRVQHPLGRIPLIGWLFQFDEYGAPGSNSTLLKSAHSLIPEKHTVTYGAQARHVSDMSNPDENFFVLLGGQDGWLKSKNNTDQVPLWKKGEYLRLPMTKKTVRALYPITTLLTSK